MPSLVKNLTPVNRYGINYFFMNACTITSVDIREIRRGNLLDLLGDGKHIEFAERIDLSASHFSQILSGRNKIGDKLARKIEERLGIKPYALDESEMRSAAEIDADALITITQHITATLKAGGADWPIEKIIRFAVDVYKLYEMTGELPDVSQATRLEILRSGQRQ